MQQGGTVADPVSVLGQPPGRRCDIARRRRPGSGKRGSYKKKPPQHKVICSVCGTGNRDLCKAAAGPGPHVPELRVCRQESRGRKCPVTTRKRTSIGNLPGKDPPSRLSRKGHMQGARSLHPQGGVHVTMRRTPYAAVTKPLGLRRCWGIATLRSQQAQQMAAYRQPARGRSLRHTVSSPAHAVWLRMQRQPCPWPDGSAGSRSGP